MPGMYYVNSNSLLSEIRSLTRNYPFRFAFPPTSQPTTHPFSPRPRLTLHQLRMSRRSQTPRLPRPRLQPLLELLLAGPSENPHRPHDPHLRSRAGLTTGNVGWPATAACAGRSACGGVCQGVERCAGAAVEVLGDAADEAEFVRPSKRVSGMRSRRLR